MVSGYVTKGIFVVTIDGMIIGEQNFMILIVMAGRAKFDSTDFARNFVKMIGACLLAFSTSGCLPSTSYGPRRLFTVEEEQASIKAQISLPNFEAYALLSPLERIAYRNNYISARMYAMDLEYSDYEAALTRERQKVGFLADVAVLGVTTASPLVGAVSTKNILAAVAAGLTGTRAAYNDEILLNQTIQILQSQMRATRSLVSAQILDRMRLNDTAYPLATAMSDLEEYYRGGTVSGALLHVGETIGENARIRRDVRDLTIGTDPGAGTRYRPETRGPRNPGPAGAAGNTRPSSPRPVPGPMISAYPETIVDDAGRRIFDFLRGRDGKIDPVKSANLKAVLAANQITVDLGPVLFDPAQASNRLILARAAGLLP